MRLSKIKKTTLYGVAFICVLGVVGCKDTNEASTNQNSEGNSLSLDMEIPNSLTGGSDSSVVVASKASFASASSITAATTFAAASSSVPCAYIGPEDDGDIFRNGYEMTKFMLSAVATWTCVSDRLIDLASFVEHNGEIIETENILGSVGYDPEDPTHYSVTDESDSQVTVRLYYAYDRFVPPVETDEPQFYLSWTQDTDDNYSGKLIIDAGNMKQPDRKLDDPIIMRMDFDRTATDQTTDMILRFDEGNQWAEGLRIHVTRDLAANPALQTYVASGLMDMKRQFFIDTGIDELPILKMYTVSDDFGNGAAIADFQDVALPLELNSATNNHLGNYIFDKTDIYAFQADGDWDWVEKTFSSAFYRGGRTTPATGGTMDPFDPSLEVIAFHLGLNTTDRTYFEGDACNNIGDDCTELLNAIFEDGFADQEPNQETDPQDWRSTAISTPDYIQTIYPNGQDWQGAFDLSFTP